MGNNNVLQGLKILEDQDGWVSFPNILKIKIRFIIKEIGCKISLDTKLNAEKDNG